MRPLALLACLAIAACAPRPATAPPHVIGRENDVPWGDRPLPFIEDDYEGALAKARASHRLLFVDGWATWCHTCLSMKAYTFRNEKVERRADDLVWASIDTEKPENAAWVAAHPMHSWPTLFIIDPESGKTVLEWPNSATPDELVRLIDVAQASRRHEGVLAKAEGRELQGNDAAAAGKMDEAIADWQGTLAIAPPGWPGRAATVESLVEALFAKKDDHACVETAERELPKVPRGGARTATMALMCATRMPPGPARVAALDETEGRVRAMAVDENEPMLPDDRSALYEALVDALKEDGRAEDAKAAATQWSTFLDGEAQRAHDPATRAVFDAHRLDAYIAIGAPERAIPMLQTSEQDSPRDYNPPARLARAYLAAGRYDDALSAIHRALGLVYGGRALRLYAVQADIFEKRGLDGDRARAAAALREGLARVGTGLGPRYAPLAEALGKRAQALEAR